LPIMLARQSVRAVQEQLRLFEEREKPPAKARRGGVPKKDAVPEFLNGRKLRDYQVQ